MPNPRRPGSAAPVAALSDAPFHARPILGIDPGLQRTGYAVLLPAPPPGEARLAEAGVIRLDRRGALAVRLAELAASVETLLQAHRPAAVVCEELYAHYRHPRTAILMGHARGVVLALAARRGLEVCSVAATNVKKILTGNGHAGKRQVQRAVAATLGLPVAPEPHDVADAIAIALCGLRLRAARQARAAASGEGRAPPAASVSKPPIDHPASVGQRSVPPRVSRRPPRAGRRPRSPRRSRA